MAASASSASKAAPARPARRDRRRDQEALSRPPELISQLRAQGSAEAAAKLAWIVKEIGDCLWYLSQLSADLGVDLEEVARLNLRKLGAWLRPRRFQDRSLPPPDRRRRRGSAQTLPRGGRCRPRMPGHARILDRRGPCG
ncbi:MAG: hypothetical protein OXP69_01600 [Spirochaetaceae bacterium]|nr:hypothetical protein [Spirochaetaceae bacterium]